MEKDLAPSNSSKLSKTRIAWTFFYQLAHAYWIGKLLFFGIIFAPRVFRVLERKDASALQQALFGPYFTSGIIAGIIMLVGLIMLRSSAKFFRTRLVLITAAIFLGVVSRYYIVPELAALQESVLQYDKNDFTQEVVREFQALHKGSVRLNMLVLVILLITLLLGV